MLALSNLNYHDAAFLPPRGAEVDASDAASLAKAITELEKQMKPTAKRLEFEEAAQLRDRIKEPRAQQIYKAQGRGSPPLRVGGSGVLASEPCSRPSHYDCMWCVRFVRRWRWR